MDEIIRCPECKHIDYGDLDKTFNAKKETENRFSVTCNNCDCEFLIEV
jgi:hypothetical protein